MIHQFLNSSIHYLHQHPHMGMLFAFIAAFLESLPILGTIIPGSVTMTMVGAMIGAGLIPAYLTLGLASIGSFCGDIIGFASGRIFKDKLRHIWPFSRYPKIISVSETFIKKHGGKSIIIGRFAGVARSAVPMVAGLLQMRWLRFLIAALPSAILWALVYCTPGIILGAFSVEIPAKALTEYICIGLGVIVGLWILYWLIQRFFSTLYIGYHNIVSRYWNTLLKKRHTSTVISFLDNHQKPNCHKQLSRLIIAVCSLVLFVLLFINVMCHTALLKINLPLFHLAQSTRIYHLDPFFIVMTLFGKPIIMLFLAFAMSFFLIVKKQWRASAHLAFGALVTTALIYLCKHAYFNPRPTGFMIVKNTSSFPSGHTTLTYMVVGFLAFLTTESFPKNRGIIYTIAGIFIALVGLSRLYLGAHWAIDILGSFFLGSALLLATIISYQRLPKKTSALTLNRWTWLCSIVTISIAVWSGNAYFGYHGATYQYTPFNKILAVSENTWWHAPFKLTPILRRNRFGRTIQPLNIQWAGKLSHINHTLLANDWTFLDRHHHIKDTVARLSSNKPQYHLPIFELLFHNKRPAAIYYKIIPHQKAIYVLRLWNSHIVFKNHKKLWIGMLNQLNPPHKLVTFAHHNLMSFAKLHSPKIIYGHSKNYQAHAKTVHGHDLPHSMDQYHWDHKVWLIRAQPTKKS